MKKFLFIILSAIFMVSCTNIKKLEQSYQLFQTGFDSLQNFQYKDLTLKEGDQLTIKAFTLATASQEQVGLFNILGGDASYLIDKDGNIKLPKIGLLKAIGKTCKQLEENITSEWSKYIKDVSVNVKLKEFSVNVLGEVASQGKKTFSTEKATVLDALAQSGGFKDESKRNNVLIVREENGSRKSYYVNLQDASFYESPAFQLQQNDMIYVSANERKFKKMKDEEFRNNMQPILQSVSVILSVLNFVILLGRR
jgi:polysaccharide export outer membrane protein